MRGFGAVLVGRARAQRVWGLEVLLGLGLLQVHQELESWFGNRIRHIVSDIDLQQEEGKAKRIREVYWKSSISKHLQMSHKEQHRHKISSEGGNGRQQRLHHTVLSLYKLYQSWYYHILFHKLKQHHVIELF